jgi:D-alanine-D-alanine ligase
MKLTILFGGSSYEHEISIVSAITLKKVLKNTRPQFVFVDAQREFYPIDPADMTAKHFSSGAYKKGKKLTLKQGGFVLEGRFGSKPFDSGTVLNLIHGRDGEDGKIAALFDFFGVPYIGPRLEAGALSFSKRTTKYLAASLGIETLPYEMLHRDAPRTIRTPYPFIVKPSRLGSSIGVSVVRSPSELDYALDVAFEFDDEVLIEPFIEGIEEYNLAGCYTDDWELSIIEAPQKEAFLDFEKKYMDFARDERVHAAKIDADLADALRASFKRIYRPLFAGSLIRCDFFVKEGTVYLNEINPIPGSMANYLFDDFEGTLTRLAAHLPTEPSVAIDYRYIHSIQSAKGKA